MIGTLGLLVGLISSLWVWYPWLQSWSKYKNKHININNSHFSMPSHFLQPPTQNIYNFQMWIINTINFLTKTIIPMKTCTLLYLKHIIKLHHFISNPFKIKSIISTLIQKNLFSFFLLISFNLPKRYYLPICLINLNKVVFSWVGINVNFIRMHL